MKKILPLAAFFAAIAMVSSGGNILLAHAQTATPTDTATLQQQLDDAKAELVQLQMQAGQVPAGDTGAPATPVTMTVTPTVTVTPTTELSQADLSQMNVALTALATLLTTLQTKAAQDPQFITSNGPVLASALGDIGQTVADIGTELNGSAVAMTVTPTPTTPNTPTTAMTPTTGNGATGATGITQANPATQPAAIMPTTAPTTQVSPTTPAAPVIQNTTPAPQTAQAASTFSFSQLNWPLIIVIVLIVAAIAIWLWWDDSDEKKKPVVVKTISPTPQKPVQQAQPLQMNTQSSTSSNSSNNSGSTNNGQNANRQQPLNSPQTPLSSAVAPHANR